MAVDVGASLTEVSDTDDRSPGADPETSGVVPARAEDAETAHRAAGQPSSRAPIRTVFLLGLVMVVAMVSVVLWTLHRDHEARRLVAQREAFLAAGREAAIYLTTLDHTRIEADVARILDMTTGTFRHGFEQRAPAFIDVIRQNQSSSTGRITEVGLESMEGNAARVLVAANIVMSSKAHPNQPPKPWRMRLDLREEGDGVKVADVRLVP